MKVCFLGKVWWSPIAFWLLFLISTTIPVTWESRSLSGILQYPTGSIPLHSQSQTGLEVGSPDFQPRIFLTSGGPPPLNFFPHFSLPDGNNDPYSSISNKCWTDWLVNAQKLLWGWKVPIIIMLSKRNSLPFKGSCRMVTDVSFECSASHMWNIYLSIEKNIST